MDLVLNVLDQHVFTPYVYPTSWPEHDIVRQLISLYLIVVVGGYILYLSLATISFYTIFDRRLMKHPQFLKVWTSVALEILIFFFNLSSWIMWLSTVVSRCCPVGPVFTEHLE